MKYRVADELFSIPWDGKYILYAPLKRLAFLVNEDTVQLLRLLQNAEFDADNDAIARVLETFQALGLINGEPDSRPHAMDEPDTDPTYVTLFPTFDCNLRCAYCYSMGGDQPASMPWEIAKAAIDLVCGNAERRGLKSFEVGFHGGGEPTANWTLLVRSVEYARELAADRGLEVSTSLASNCVWSQQQTEWVAANVKGLTVSLDGPPEIQDLQRPLRGGGGSYGAVARTLKHLDHLGYAYGIRSTVSAASVEAMSYIVAHFCKEFHPRSIHLEPLFVCGRCLTSGLAAPTPQAFLREYRNAQDVADANGVRLYYSGARLDSLTSTFCGATGRNLVVLPDGSITSCLEVCRDSDPRSSMFFYGKYDPRTGSFRFDRTRQELLQSRSVDRIQGCSDCYLKWHCAGDCPAKAVAAAGEFLSVGHRCWLNQELAKGHLFDLLTRRESRSSSALQFEVLPC